VDIYLSYRRIYPKHEDTLEVGAEQSREKNQLYNRLKPLMGNKRVLAIRPAKTVVTNGVNVVEKGSQLVVELQDREVKMLKGLGGELANISVSGHHLSGGEIDHCAALAGGGMAGQRRRDF
jgi:pilus assembly protein CpaB